MSPLARSGQVVDCERFSEMYGEEQAEELVGEAFIGRGQLEML